MNSVNVRKATAVSFVTTIAAVSTLMAVNALAEEGASCNNNSCRVSLQHQGGSWENIVGGCGNAAEGDYHYCACWINLGGYAVPYALQGEDADFCYAQ